MLFPKRIVVGFGFLALGAAAVLLMENRATPPKLQLTADDRSIQRVIRDGYSELQTAIVPATPVCPGPVPAKVQQKMLDDLHATLPRSFAGPALTRYETVLEANFSGDGPACAFGGGVSAVDLTSVAINGSSAEAHARITKWARAGQYQGNGRIVYAQPSGPEDCTIKLQKTAGSWLINDDRCSFPSGSGP